MITLQDYILALQKIDAKYLNMPVIYATDDEGNSYQNINNLPDLIEVKNPNEYYLELVWDEDGETLGTNFNAIIIN